MIKYLEDFSRNKNTWWASCVQPVLAPAQYIYIYILHLGVRMLFETKISAFS